MWTKHEIRMHQNTMSFWDTFDLQKIRPFHTIKKIDYGERRIHRISNSDNNYIIIEKFTGTSLKMFLNKLSYMMNFMPANHTYFIIHKTKHPFFFDPIPNVLYFSDSKEYATFHQTSRKYVIGSTNCCIEDTFGYLKYTELEGCKAPKNEYYMIIASGTNQFDCSEKYVRTRELKGAELQMRIAQKRIIIEIVYEYLSICQKVAILFEEFNIHFYDISVNYIPFVILMTVIFLPIL